jgi:hypothetical protein
LTFPFASVSVTALLISLSSITASQWAKGHQQT